MSRPMNLIFEPMDLQAASPATVSRNGMVYMEPKSLGWRILLDSWINTLPSHFSEEEKKHIYSLIDWLAEPLMEYIRGNIEESSPTQDQNILKTLMKFYNVLIKDMADPEHYELYKDPKQRIVIFENKFIFALTWSFGASADSNNRKKIEAEIKKYLSGVNQVPEYEKRKLSFPERNTLYDWNYIPKRGTQAGSGFEWVLWTDFIDLNEKISKHALPQEIIVKTNDSVRYS